MHCENCGSTRIDALPIPEQNVIHIRCYDCNFEWVE